MPDWAARPTLYDEAMNRAAATDAPGNADQGLRVAFFGGSFDPPHLGHLAIARAARDALNLQKVLFAPVGAQPLKPEGTLASFDDRVAMTQLAIAGDLDFAISLADAPRPGDARGSQPNYTINTLKNLRAEIQPGTELFCLMGADAFFGLRQWHRAPEIPFAASLIVASRHGQPLNKLQAALPPGLTIEPFPAGDRNQSGTQNSSIDVRAFVIVNPAGERAPFYVLPGLDIEISATVIREAIRNSSPTKSSGEPGSAALQTMLPAGVANYIRAHGLYR
ncbi:MAG TPA: nicotinate (nicotinamide) nucleotide adenylyltransferase [Terracidiphilus sp.]|jgi:nicotinate-nucleotide adenylyltransferase